MPKCGHREDVLIDGGALVSVDSAIGTLDSAQIYVRSGKIEAVGTDVSVPTGTKVVDARGMIVMPGLVDTHFHMWSTLARNFVSDSHGYFAAKWATSALYEPDDVYWSVLLGALEAANSGITTVHNWSHNTRTPAHADAELSAHLAARVRARFSHGHPDLIPEDQPLDFTAVDRVRREFFEPASSAHLPLIHLGVNLRGPDLSDPEVFYREMALAQERGLPVSIHASSHRVDAVDLDRRGFLGPDFLISHYLAARDDDITVMARTATPLTFSVHSELRLSRGGDPRTVLKRFVHGGVPVSLSIDAASIAPVNLFEAMSFCWNMGVSWDVPLAEDAPLTFQDCIEMATIGGARSLGLADEIGSITPGKQADLIMIRTTDLGVAPVLDLKSTVVRSVGPANVDSVMVDGRFLKLGGRLLGHDVPSVIDQAEKSARRIWGASIQPDRGR